MSFAARSYKLRIVLIASAMVALAACNVQPGTSDGGAAAQPTEVDAETLRGAVSDTQARRFYEAREWRAAWSAPAAAALTQALSAAGRHGLDPRAFLAPVEAAQGAVARDAALTTAGLAYAEALARGRIDPETIHAPYSVPRPETDVAAGLSRAIDSDVVAWLEALAPQDAEYRTLSNAYVGARRQAAQTPRRAPIPAGRDIRPGGADPRLGAIASALAGDGYFQAAEGQTAPSRLTPQLVAAVRRVQEDYGLTANGVIGADTLAAINEGPYERARTLAVNLERRRWLAREAPSTRIDVNTAAAALTYWRRGEPVDRRRVVVGDPEHMTPELGSPIYRLVANPTWTVPRSIQNGEIAREGPGYLARNNMETRDGWIVQRSGPTNSLGLVKFDMQNEHAIYLHDTPAKALFAQDDRHSSHGCVRVFDALGFAALIAEHEGVTDAWNRARATGEETMVALPNAIPVRLIYQTAFVDGDRVRYRLDEYGWDDAVARGLGLQPRGPRAPRQRARDTGP